MNPNIIAALAVIGYIIISAVIMGLAERKENDAGIIIAFLWPIFLVAIVVLGIGYLPYKIVKNFPTRKKK